MPDRNDMGVVGKDLVGDWVDIFVILILCKVQFDEALLFQRLAVRGVRVVLQKPSQYVLVVKDDSLGGADGRGEGL
jgi:hypothetical protein